jgi:hypothetical protein
LVERQPSKLAVASSSLVSRSIYSILRQPQRVSINLINLAHVAQSVERFLGKEEVHRFDSGRGLHFIMNCLMKRSGLALKGI